MEQLKFDKNTLENLHEDESGGYNTLLGEPSLQELVDAAREAGYPLEKVFLSGYEEGVAMVWLDESLTNFDPEVAAKQWS